ncbi:predicted protein [Chaetoceros tenuissimus]|uniref:Kinesin light chain n=1 Tax=Chaetoceros tenuissimus TaxID=426638 RepID=A0AAD3D1V5_9STRA|nr:predicted protein [Chaetoceros tenuissimus]
MAEPHEKFKEGNEHHRPVQEELTKKLREEITYRTRLYGEQQSVAESYNSLALVYHHMLRDSQQALKYHREAMRILTKVKNNPNSSCTKQDIAIRLGVTACDIGNAQWALHKHKEAEKTFHQSISYLDEGGVPENHPRYLAIKNRLTTLYRHTDTPQEVGKDIQEHLPRAIFPPTPSMLPCPLVDFHNIHHNATPDTPVCSVRAKNSYLNDTSWSAGSGSSHSDSNLEDTYLHANDETPSLEEHNSKQGKKRREEEEEFIDRDAIVSGISTNEHAIKRRRSV